MADEQLANLGEPTDGEKNEGLDVEVDVTGSTLDNPDEPVHMWNQELGVTNLAPRHAYEALWVKRGWVEFDPEDLDHLPWQAAVQDGADTPPADEVPKDEKTSAAPAKSKGGTTDTAAAPAADK